MFAERRKHPRLPVLLVGTARADAAVLEVVCTNVGPGGGFFSCKIPPAQGAEVSVQFRPFGPDGPEVFCKMEVSWQSVRGGGHPPGFGAIWRSISSPDGPAAVRLFAEETLKLFGTEPTTSEDGGGLLQLGRLLPPRSGVYTAEPVAPQGLEQAGPQWSNEDDFVADFNPPTVPAVLRADGRHLSSGAEQASMTWSAPGEAEPAAEVLPDLPLEEDALDLDADGSGAAGADDDDGGGKEQDLAGGDADDGFDLASDEVFPSADALPAPARGPSGWSQPAPVPALDLTPLAPQPAPVAVAATATVGAAVLDPWDADASAKRADALAAHPLPSRAVFPSGTVFSSGIVQAAEPVAELGPPPAAPHAVGTAGVSGVVPPVVVVSPAATSAVSSSVSPPLRAPSEGSPQARPASAMHAASRPLAGIRGRDLLQDSDTWIPHSDEPSDVELLALAAPPAPPAEEVAARTVVSSDDPGLARLRESLAAKLGSSGMQSAVSMETVLADARQALGLVGTAAERLSGVLPAASTRASAPLAAQAAATVRAAAAAESDAPVGDRTEVVDPRHMANLLTQFGSLPVGAAPAARGAGALPPLPGTAAGQRPSAPQAVAPAVSPTPARTNPALGSRSTVRDSSVGQRPPADSLAPRFGVLRPAATVAKTEAPGPTPAVSPAPSSEPPVAAAVPTQAAASPASAAAGAASGAVRTVGGSDTRRSSSNAGRASSTGHGGAGQLRPTAQQIESVGKWRPPTPAAPQAAPESTTKPSPRATGTPLAQMPSLEAVPLLPFGTMQLAPEPVVPAAANVAASLPDAFSSQLHAAAPVWTSPAASLVAAGVEAAVTGSQRGEATVAYAGRQTQSPSSGTVLRENTPNLGTRASQALEPRGGPSGLSDSWPGDVPRSVGTRYDQLQRLGRGGHGVVYKARDRNLDRAVVLKFLQSSQLNTEVARRYFLREVKLAAGLSHPNILHIYDVAEAEGVLYYAMEFIDGVTLSAYLPGGQALTDLAFLFSVVQQLADALDHAHAAGVLHRDVKPENVLVGKDGIVKLFDFGLARMSQESDKSKEGSMLIGTPYYMAPEQLMGQPVDARADQYALGVSLFKMLTGELPFKDGNVYAAHVLDPVPDPLRWNPHLPVAVRNVIERSMAKAPADRYPNCKALALALWQALFSA